MDRILAQGKVAATARADFGHGGQHDEEEGHAMCVQQPNNFG